MKNVCFFSVFFLVFGFNTFSQTWHTDFEKAKEVASSKNENIVLVFQGSDWCAPCIKLDKEIWSTQEFQKLSKDHFVMLKADFPRRKANKLSESVSLQNAKLAETYNNQGYFPLVVVLDNKGKVLGKIGYEKSNPSTYFKKLTAFEN
ncbi:Thioredoxin-like [Flaviramulus basaltis]|uniref:Thioredoxin-like n=1 Tax=Flaviramulus basaltis TaxID=369401 RepID=A0A1K2IHE8_9FLAO|nr:thioredoxin family protein [Flaviramulus basaltis]SFZ91807.1 Thioredoxin-like [Flaviramulus basaltis]